MQHPEVVVVTGAAAGVGRAVARRFARAGARLGLIARDREALETVKGEVQALGGEAMVLPADVADAEAVLAAARRVQAAWGGIDVWINDAMVTVFSPLSEMTPQEFRRVTDVTYLGFVHGTMAALEAMRPKGRGAVVQVGSALAYRGIPLQSAYCGAKHAIRGFTDSVRAELLHDGARITLSIVELPAMNTPQFDWGRTHMDRQPRPMGRVYEPEAAAEAVFRAARTGVREYWVGRTTALTILGNMLLPGFMDRYLAHSAVKGQERKTPVSPDRRDNLNAPVHGLHSTHGSFEREAHRKALVIPGQAARWATAALGAALCIGAGIALGRGLTRRSA